MMRRYPAYRDSGVAWLGEVPEGWMVIRSDAVLRTHVDLVSADALDGREIYHYSIPVVQSTGQGQFEDGSEVQSSKLLVSEPQVLVSKLNPRKGTACIAHVMSTTTVASSEFIPLISSSVNLKFTFYTVVSDLFRQRLEARVESATKSHQRVLPSDIAKFEWALPPIAEQTAIAAFLDRETAKIDALVDEQRRLIALLREKRQAVISHAVTKGLNPAATMKPSGVDWLGDVPEEWEVYRIKDVAKMESGHTPDRSIAAYWSEDEIPWVSLADTKALKESEYISQTSHYITDAGIANSSARLLPAGVVVFSRDATIGRCAITTMPMAVSQHFIAWVCGEGIDRDYLLFCLRAMQGELERLTFGATLKTIGMPDVRRLSIALPKLAQQREIVLHIRLECRRLDELIVAASSAMQLLTERRAALISAAVTGKIDVRHLTDKASEAA